MRISDWSSDVCSSDLVYIDAFCALAREALARSDNDYEAFCEPGNLVTPRGALGPGSTQDERLPQMPAYHLKAPNHGGITMVNIEIGRASCRERVCQYV